MTVLKTVQNNLLPRLFLPTIKQKGKSQNRCYMKTRHAGFSAKQTFLTSSGKRSLFFGKFGVLCFLWRPFWDSPVCLIADVFIFQDLNISFNLDLTCDQGSDILVSRCTRLLFQSSYNKAVMFKSNRKTVQRLLLCATIIYLRHGKNQRNSTGKNMSRLKMKPIAKTLDLKCYFLKTDLLRQ